MDPKRPKVFRDPVHGYIQVPREFCSLFVDTPIFQRLRNIVQTSMRPLYPSAHHDRFAHSLGVYHLSRLAFQHLKSNTQEGVLKGIKLEQYENPFTVAALMHDCGHAPFSHTFESFFNRDGRAETFLFDQVSKGFKKDYHDNYEVGEGPAEHEVFSAGIFLKHYASKCKSLLPKNSAELVARMITGCTHQPATNREQELENCFICLIHGDAIDVDKLDYIVRDTWASGVNNSSIDLTRLLSALRITEIVETVQEDKQTRVVVAFEKSALSVVQSVIDGRNFLHNWIYAHHTVSYHSALLKKALTKLSRLVTPKKPDRLIDVMFSNEVFDRPVRVADVSLYLPCDGDIFYLLKQRSSKIPEVAETLSRQPLLIPLWKTRAEFEFIFRQKDSTIRARIRAKAHILLKPLLGKAASAVMVLQVMPKVSVIEESELYIALGESVVPYTQLALSGHADKPADKSEKPKPYFYVFIPREARPKLQECIKVLVSAKYY
jgi:uncharacterized protein